MSSILRKCWENVRPYAPFGHGELEVEILEVRELLRVQETELNEMQVKLAESLPAVAHARELSARLSATDKLLLERTVELRAAQAFLTRTDDISEAELVGMIESLNTLISSVSGALSDWDQRDPVPEILVNETDLEQIRHDFGNSTLEQIAARNRVAVTLAIQLHLGYFVERVTSGWGDGQVAETLGEIYGMISTRESQAIASRWRTLTKRYMPNQELPQMEGIIGGVAQILMVTRSFSDLSEAMDSVKTDAGIEIKAVIEAALELDDVIKTKIASNDMLVHVVPPGTMFVKGMMTDEFGEGGEGHVVAGTTEIGLLRRSVNAEKVLRRPKVILERDLVNPE